MVRDRARPPPVGEGRAVGPNTSRFLTDAAAQTTSDGLLRRRSQDQESVQTYLSPDATIQWSCTERYASSDGEGRYTADAA